MSTVNANWPRVSTILKVLDNAYGDVPEAVLAKAAERGENLHQLCLTYLASLEGMCPEPIPTPPYVQAYAAFQSWVKDNQVRALAIEQESESAKYQFRGTPDALILYGPHELPTILDLKFTASILRTNRVQVQAYWRLDLYKNADRVMLLHVKPVTGELKALKITKDPRDWAAFLNALSVWKWRQL